MAEVTLENVQTNLPLVDEEGMATPYFEDWLFAIITDLNTITAGTVASIQNVGGGAGVWRDTVSAVASLRSLESSDGSVAIAEGADTIDLIASSLADGTVNNSILTWSGTEWTELAELLFSHSAGAVTMQVEDSLGADQIVGLFDADAESSLYYDGAAALRTAAVASGGAEANNTLTGAGWERVLTASDLVSSITDLTATAWRTFYSDGSGNLTELALGTSGFVLTSNGPAAAPSWQAGGGGSLPTPTVESSILTGDLVGGDFDELTEVTIAWAAGVTTIQGEDDLGTLRDLIVGDADAEVGLYYDGNVTLETQSQGIDVFHPTNSGTAQARLVAANNQNSAVNFNESTSTRLQIQYRPGDALARIRVTQLADDFSIINDTDGSWIYCNQGGSVDVFYDGILAAQSANNGWWVFDTNGDDPIINLFDDTNQTAGDQLSSIRGRGLSGTEFRNHIDGGYVQLLSDDALGSTQVCVSGDGDGATDLYFDGTAVAGTRDQGIYINASAGNAQMRMQEGGTDRVLFFYDRTNNWAEWRAMQNSDLVKIRATDSVGTVNDLLDGDPDGAVELLYDGNVVFATSSQGAQFTATAGVAGVLEISADSGQVVAINFEQGASSDAQIAYRPSNNDLRLRLVNTGDDFVFENDADGEQYRIGNDQMAWYGNTPISRPNYTLNTYSTDRNLTSSGSVTLSEVADVLATLIQDLIDYGLLQ